MHRRKVPVFLLLLFRCRNSCFTSWNSEVKNKRLRRVHLTLVLDTSWGISGYLQTSSLSLCIISSSVTERESFVWSERCYEMPFLACGLFLKLKSLKGSLLPKFKRPWKVRSHLTAPSQPGCKYHIHMRPQQRKWDRQEKKEQRRLRLHHALMYCFFTAADLNVPHPGQFLIWEVLYNVKLFQFQWQIHWIIHPKIKIFWNSAHPQFIPDVL